MSPPNYLTIDFERLGDREVYNNIHFDRQKEEVMLEDSLNHLINILKVNKVKATFFVIGEIIRDYPYLCKRIILNGHALGLHGWTHRRLNELSRSEFEKEIEKSLKVYEKNLGVKPMGFRAPQFSLGKETRWALDILYSKGFRYDSSIYPCGVGFYGGNTGPVYPYTPSKDDPSKPSESEYLVEFPALVYKYKKFRIPMGGGFWSRFFGFKLQSSVIGRMNAMGYSTTSYLHNWEFLDNRRWLRKRVYSYRNYGIPIDNKKIKSFLSSHKFTSIETYFQGK